METLYGTASESIREYRYEIFAPYKEEWNNNVRQIQAASVFTDMMG